jgi:hypothetical protein
MQLLIGGAGPLRRGASWRRPVASGATADRREAPSGGSPLASGGRKEREDVCSGGLPSTGAQRGHFYLATGGDISILP